MYYLLTMFAVSCLATGGIFVKLSSLGPVTTGFYRVFIAFIGISLFQLIANETNSKLPNKTKLILMIAGSMLAFDLILWNISFYHTTVANANLLANMVPFFSVPISYFLLKEKVTKKYLLSLMLALIGVIVLIGGKISFTQDKLYGDALAFFTAFFYAAYLLIVSSVSQNIGFSNLMKYVSLGAAIILLPISLMVEDKFWITEYSQLYPLIGLALIAHLGGQGLLAVSMKKTGILIASMIVLSQPMFAALYSYFLFSEKLSMQEMLGIIVILSAIYIAKSKAPN